MYMKASWNLILSVKTTFTLYLRLSCENLFKLFVPLTYKFLLNNNKLQLGVYSFNVRKKLLNCYPCM